MKILILGDANSIHIKRWIKALSEQNNIELCLFSLEENKHQNYHEINNLTIIESGKYIKDSKFRFFKKVGFILKLTILKKIIRTFKPDIVHAHYATSYGTLGALSGFNPFIVSVWGSDIYDFPKQNWLFKKIIQFNLKKANQILSTSHIMARETKKYTNKPVRVTPFGVDTSVFKKINSNNNNDGKIILGTVKTLEEKYGIDTLIDTFALLSARNSDNAMELHIAGSGTKTKEYKDKVKALNISDKVFFAGRIPNTSVIHYINKMNVYVALSRFDSESFGVAIVEAMACEVPVVVSDVDGLSEVVDNKVTGFVVPKENPELAANAIEKILSDSKLAIEMGKNGRLRVKKLYEWKKNVGYMIEIYNNILEKKI